MNSTILAERQAKAIQAIQEETARLGGEYVQPTGRVDSPATKYVLILEAVATALKGIVIETAESPESAPEPDPPTPAPKAAGKRKGL